MSNVFAQLVRTRSDGAVPLHINAPVGADATMFQGVKVSRIGVAYASEDPVSYISNGTAFDAQGRVCIALAPPAHYASSLPLAATGALSVTTTTSPTDRVNQGLTFTAVGGVLVVLESPPPPLLDDFNQTDFLAGDFA